MTRTKANFLNRNFIFQIREKRTYNLIENWTEEGISGLREKFQTINVHKRNAQFHP